MQQPPMDTAQSITRVVPLEQIYRFEQVFRIRGTEPDSYETKTIKVLLHVVLETSEFFLQMDDIFNAANGLVTLRGTNVIGNFDFNAEEFRDMLSWLQEIVKFAQGKLQPEKFIPQLPLTETPNVVELAIDFSHYCYVHLDYEEKSYSRDDIAKAFNDFQTWRVRPPGKPAKKKPDPIFVSAPDNKKDVDDSLLPWGETEAPVKLKRGWSFKTFKLKGPLAKNNYYKNTNGTFWTGSGSSKIVVTEAEMVKAVFSDLAEVLQINIVGGNTNTTSKGSYYKEGNIKEFKLVGTPENYKLFVEIIIENDEEGDEIKLVEVI